MREGFAIEDFEKPNRIIIGVNTEKAIKLMKKLYKPYTNAGIPSLVMDECSAELAKYAANAFLATKIIVIKEVANFCEHIGSRNRQSAFGDGT